MKNNVFALFATLLISLPLYVGAQVSFDEERLLERLKTLSSDAFEGRRTGEEGNAKARAYLISEFKKLNVKSFGSKYDHRFSFKVGDKEYNAVNVLAQFKGTEHPDKYIVVSAHYDHLGIQKGKIYNGADDDASGVAALFSFAEYLTKNPPKHTVVIAAFDAEELGLRGAKYFVEKMKNTTIVANINMDMISRSPKNEIYVVGTRYNESLKKIIEGFKNPTSTKILIGHDGTDGKQDWTYASDHGPFHAQKIPFLYFGDEDHPGYHHPSDDFENITPDFYKNTVKIILSVFTEIDKKGL
ncbi:M20/M25/M40 family metallo-hydrolase [Leptobacterium flavescens]|uniref:M20/M25/M40 family metallo-hydrolase n=1 Tax=Leptobacterium flavescens TaxID=472055 RepID=A0A6P0UMT4_9FLAO|nr:M20/M25/M40 family metallo-hydrolase [Leptobacterium flavescens]NER13178.1 M20/M25/M40 family metallo-hydrolase [Leptobacterium flavescens]